MNVFSAVEGMIGENLSSALLRFVLMRSQDARAKFANLVSDLTGDTYSVSYRFACNLEVTTAHDSHGNGRIDLLIEMDDALVGIESKFNADFQIGQPEKYFPSLGSMATKSAESGAIRKNRYLMLILAPAKRRGEIEKKIEGMGKEHQLLCKFLSWEDVITELREISSAQDSKTREVIADFAEYVDGYMEQSMFSKNKRWFEFLNQWLYKGSERQIKVVSELWEFFPETSSMPSKGDKWYGYYFNNNRGWFGFVERSMISAESNLRVGHREAVFVIVTTFESSSTPDPTVFHRINMTNIGFCHGRPEKEAYSLNINDMTAREKWTAVLTPFFIKKPKNEVSFGPIS